MKQILAAVSLIGLFSSSAFAGSETIDWVGPDAHWMQLGNNAVAQSGPPDEFSVTTNAANAVVSLDSDSSHWHSTGLWVGTPSTEVDVRLAIVDVEGSLDPAKGKMEWTLYAQLQFTTGTPVIPFTPACITPTFAIPFTGYYASAPYSAFTPEALTTSCNGQMATLNTSLGLGVANSAHMHWNVTVTP